MFISCSHAPFIDIPKYDHAWPWDADKWRNTDEINAQIIRITEPFPVFIGIPGGIPTKGLGSRNASKAMITHRVYTTAHLW